MSFKYVGKIRYSFIYLILSLTWDMYVICKDFAILLLGMGLYMATDNVYHFMQIVLYKFSRNIAQSEDNKTIAPTKKWVYVHSVRCHTHDVRALTLAVPISCEG